MNECDFISNANISSDNDVCVECETTVSGQIDTERSGCVPGSESLAEPGTTAKRPKWLLLCVLLVVIEIIMCLFLCINSYAAESSVYVDSSYMAEQFGSYKYYAIVTDGNGNYATLFTNGKMISNGGVVYSLMSYDDYGFKMMKLENEYLVIDDTGKSYSGRSSVTVQLNAISYGIPSGMNTIRNSIKLNSNRRTTTI